MYKRALVPVDGSGNAESILPFVTEMAGPMGIELVLVRVVSAEKPSDEERAQGGFADYESRRSAAERDLDAPVLLFHSGVR